MEFVGRIHLFHNAPQISILQKADLMITHAGGNSIKECMRFCIPMLCFPNDNDQFGNAARVVHNRIGLTGDFIKDSPTAIMRKIKRLLNKPIFKRNLVKFHNQFIEKERSFEAARIVESLLSKEEISLPLS